jgi:hypothetical protein
VELDSGLFDPLDLDLPAVLESLCDFFPLLAIDRPDLRSEGSHRGDIPSLKITRM